MFRKARLVGQVLRSLLLGSAAITAVASTSVVMVGCADENQPETWVKRLDDPIKRPAAVKRLVQFFNDAMTRANKDRENPKVKELLDKTVEPLTKVYVEGNLDDRTRIELIQHLADTRDPRAKEAWFKACTDFAQSKGATEDDVRWAAPAIAALKLEDGAQPLADAFVKLQAGTQKGSQAYRNLHSAMLAIKSPSWKPMLLERLNRPIERPEGGDAAKVTAYQNELFWQTTSAQLLGELRDSSAIKPLFKAVMTPAKADVAGTASSALLKIGKDAVPVLVDILTGKDEEIRDYAISISGGNPEQASMYVSHAAVMLGGIGHPDATAPMLEALSSARSESTKAVIARALTSLPATPETVKAFQAAFEQISPSTMIPPVFNARELLMEESVRFYDPELVPWILKQVSSAKGEEHEKGVVQTAGLVSAIKLMNKAQMPEVQKAVEKFGSPIEKEAFAMASEVVTACDDQFACYLSKTQESEVQEQNKQFLGIKAGTMLAVRGEASQAQAIVEVLPKIKNGAVRFATVAALNHLVRKDTAPVVAALEKLIAEDEAKGDADRIQSNEPVKQVLYRLRAR